MTVRVVTPPASEPVTLAEVKAYARVDTSADDSLLSAMIVAAREAGENETRRAFMPQTLELTLDAFPRKTGRRAWSSWLDYAVDLPRPPLASVTSVSYLDPAGVLQTLGPSAYVVSQLSDAIPACLAPAFGASWPDTQAMPGAVRVRYTAGWADPESVPEAIRAWIRAKVATMYEHREEFMADARAAAVEYPNRFIAGLLDPWRVLEFA